MSSLATLLVQAPENGKLSKKSYDFDSKDYFWAKNAANPFPQVAEDIDSELNRYKTDAAEITRSTGMSDVNDVSQMLVLSISSPILSRRRSVACVANGS